MIDMALADAEAMSVDLKIPVPKLKGYLEKSKALFEQVTIPCLVHWDLWDGNIFIKNGRIADSLTGSAVCGLILLWRWGSVPTDRSLISSLVTA